MVSGFFGMNLVSGVENAVGGFWIATILSTVCSTPLRLCVPPKRAPYACPLCQHALGTPELSSSLSRSVAGLALSSSATASTSVSTRLSAWTSLSLERCCRETLRKRRVQEKKHTARPMRAP